MKKFLQAIRVVDADPTAFAGFLEKLV